MNRYITALVALVATLQLSAQTIWHNPQDAAINPIEGQYWQGEQRSGFYNRMPDRFKDDMRERVWDLSTNNSGESILFRTNSKNIKIRYTLNSPKDAMVNMSAIGAKGVDLYASDSEGESFRVVGDVSFGDTCVYNCKKIEYFYDKDNDGYNYQLYLPLYNGVKEMKIGVDKGAEFEFLAPSKEKPIVVYGTSIAHGASASRAAMSWTSQLSRSLNMPLYNIAFSGNGRLEDVIIGAIGEIDASIYIIDCMPNLQHTDSAELVKLICRQIRTLRNTRPEIPILLTDHIGYSRAASNLEFKNLAINTIDAQREAFKILTEEGITGLYHLDNKTLNMPYDAYVDAIHPSDYGMWLYAQSYEKVLREILSLP